MSNRGFYKGFGPSPVRHASQEIERAADPVEAQDVATRNFVRGASSVTPSYFPATAQRRWEPFTSMYGWDAANLHKIRAAIKKTATSGGLGTPLHILFIGDSTLIGYNGATYNADRSLPRQFGLALSAILGGIPYTDGAKIASVAELAPLDDRLTLTGSFSTHASTDYNFLYSTGAGTAKRAFLDAGTSVEFYYSDLSTTGFTYSIDGGGAVSVTTGGTAAILAKTISGLSDIPHTITITTTGANTFIYGFRTFSPGLVQIHCHNLALGGSRANAPGTNAGGNWSDTTTSGINPNTIGIMTAAGVTPDLVVACIGNNDVYSGTIQTAEGVIAGITGMRAMYPNTPFVFMHPPLIPTNAGTTSQTDPALFDRFSGQIITMIDSMSQAMYFSWDDWDGRSAGYVADGLAGADNIHPTDAEAMSIGRHLAVQVAGPEVYSTPMTAQALIADVTTSGTAEQITYQRFIPSWFWRAGGTIRVVTSGTCTSGTTPVLTATNCRIGTAGTTADTSVAVTGTTATVAAGAGWRYEVEITCRTVGTSGTVAARATLIVNGIAVVISADTTTPTINTNVYNYLTITLTPGGTTPVFVQRMAFCDVPPGP